MGEVDLRGYLIEVHRLDAIVQLCPSPGTSGKPLNIHVEDRDCFEQWVEAITEHLHFREKTDKFLPPPSQNRCVIL